MKISSKSEDWSDHFRKGQREVSPLILLASQKDCLEKRKREGLSHSIGLLVMEVILLMCVRIQVCGGKVGGEREHTRLWDGGLALMREGKNRRRK